MISYPHLNPIALSLGPVKIHWYGIMYLLGFAAGWWLGRRRAAQPGSTWRPVDVDDFIFFMMLGVILGGRLGYVFFYGLDFWRADIWYPFKVWDGGMSYHGGLIGVIFAAWFFARRRQRAFGDVCDFATPLPGLGFFFGRIGNFINSELWGRPTTVPWGFRIEDPMGGPAIVRHPTQLYEATLEGLVLFAVLWWYTSTPRPRWAPSGLFLTLYAVFRIGVEFFRLPDIQVGYLAGGWFTRGMELSLPMLVVGLSLLWWAHSRRTPSGNLQSAVAGAA